MKKLVLVLVIASICLGAFGCAQEAAPAPAPGPAPTKTVTKTVQKTVTATPVVKEWKIGSIFAYSGAAASIFESFKKCLDMQAEEINAAGGVKADGVTYMIRFVHEDNELTIEKTVAAFRKLAYQDNVKHIIGPGVPFLTASFKDERDELKVLQFDCTSIFDAVGPYGFKVKYTGDLGLVAITNYVAEVYPEVKRYAVLGANEAGSRGAWDAVKAGIDKMPGRFEVIEPVWYEPETLDFAPILTGILAKEPDIIDTVHSSTEPGLLIIKQARELGYKGVISGFYIVSKEEMDAVVPKEHQYDLLSEGMIWENLSTPALEDFYNKFVAKYGGDPYPSDIHVIDALPVMVKAAELAGTIDTTAMVKELESWKTVPNFLTGESTWGGVETTGYAHAVNSKLPLLHINAAGEWVPVVSPVIEVP